MGAVQSFDSEVIPKMNAVQEDFANTMSKMVPAIGESIELAKRHGLGALQRDLENALPGVEAVVKMFTELSTCLDEYAAHVRRVENALG